MTSVRMQLCPSAPSPKRSNNTLFGFGPQYLISPLFSACATRYVVRPGVRSLYNLSFPVICLITHNIPKSLYGVWSLGWLVLHLQDSCALLLRTHTQVPTTTGCGTKVEGEPAVISQSQKFFSHFNSCSWLTMQRFLQIPTWFGDAASAKSTSESSENLMIRKAEVQFLKVTNTNKKCMSVKYYLDASSPFFFSQWTLAALRASMSVEKLYHSFTNRLTRPVDVDIIRSGSYGDSDDWFLSVR